MTLKITKKGIEKDGNVFFIPKILKGDTYMVLADSAVEMEDEFKNLYFTANDTSKIFIQPPYEPKMLKKFVVQNNILSQCIDAMEVNIDGTGWSFHHVDEKKTIEEAEKKVLDSFFNEPYPGKSFLPIRRELRRDIESMGYGFLEVLRNLKGDLVGVRNVVGQMIRLVRLDKAVPITRKLMRAGTEVDFTINERERRYVQRVNNTDLYFKEFGSTRKLNKKTGYWESADNPVMPEDEATELLMFGLNKDINTAYSVPRWINQLPAVLGSRKAEEQNLEFFDAGGIPPAIIFIQGGSLSKSMADQLKQYLSGQAKSNNRAVVVEAQSSSGSIDKESKVDVKVERFGADSQKDTMFATYDKNAEERVRTAFRLPPLFLGKAVDYNFATAKTAYMVAEAQVFSPERKEFDEIINRTIIKALGVKNAVMKSNPITIKDVEFMMKALELSKDCSDGEGWMQEMNALAGVNLKYKEPPEPPALPTANGSAFSDASTLPQPPTKKPQANLTAVEQKVQTLRAVKKATELLELAKAYAGIEGLIVQKQELTDVDRETVVDRVHCLEGDDLEEFLDNMHLLAVGTPVDVHGHAH